MTELQNDSASTASAISGDFGDAVLVLMKSPQFAERPLSSLGDLLLAPMERGQLVLARGKDERGRPTPVALICVAKLSDEIHERMLADPAGTELSGADWASGTNIWFALLDGPPDFARPFAIRVRDEMFGGQPVWIRVRDKDGAVRVATLD